MEAVEKNFQDLVTSEEEPTTAVTTDVEDEIIQQILTSEDEVEETTEVEESEELEEGILDDDDIEVLSTEEGWEDVSEEDLAEMEAVIAELKAENPDLDLDEVDIVINEDGEIEIRPIAGTRQRGGDEAEDAYLANGLLKDEKEKAEHLMLVDLGRNDVGRAAVFDSVRVKEFMVVEYYSHVMHIVSDVRGKLQDGKDVFDALYSGFPAGTLTGAPKIRAMEIIHDLEPHRRGIYSGAIGYFDFTGDMNTCIAIRTMVVKDKNAYFQSGAGIVYDSNPEKEFEETVSKAKAINSAIDLAENGLVK